MQDFNPAMQYNNDEVYYVKGKILNEIGQCIRDLLKLEVEKDLATDQELKVLRIREKNPAVKDAWNKYQTVLKLADDDL